MAQAMDAQPKHRAISEQLLSEIAAGKYAPSGRLPTEMQLVKRFQVSRPTVARALRDLEAEGLIVRRPGSGTFVQDGPGKAASARQLGLLVPGLARTEILGLICGELASLARAHEFALLWGSATPAHPEQDMTREQALQLCAHFVDQQVKGVFFAPFELAGDQAALNQRIADQLGKAGVPTVLLDRDIVPFPRRSHFDLAGIDNLAGGGLLAEHLIKLGCRRIAFVARPHSAPTINARIAGVREALTSQKLEVPPDWIQVGDPEDTKFVRSLVAGRLWDGIVCANDLTAAQLLRTFAQNNIHVPHDVRVVGFDDAKYATLLGVSLTTMRQPCRDIAITAFHAMLERMADPTLPPRSLLITPQLVVRESCGAYLPRPGTSATASRRKP
jgi:DNA-binding LacI/PurR family transcriptional regulator